MPTKMRRLQKEAKQACLFRGHKMGNFQWYYEEPVTLAWCESCHMQVEVNTNPQPNQIEISGQAVALNCSCLGFNGPPREG